MDTYTDKPALHQPFNKSNESLVTAFYDLRKAFENQYSGKLRSEKYEETRAFTISLNYAIFQANRALEDETAFYDNSNRLKTELKNLQQVFRNLMQ